MSRNYLFVMWEGGGNVPPLLGLAERAIARGHRVTVLGDPTIREEAERSGCGFISWRRAPHRSTLRPEDDLLKDWETKNPFQMLSRFRDRFITTPAPDFAADTLDAIDATSPDALVPEYTLFGAMMAAEKRGLPIAALVPNIWPMPVKGAPPFGPGFLPAKSFLGRARDALFTSVVVSIFDRALPSLNETRGRLGLAPLASFFDQALRSDALFVLSSAAFDFSSRSVPNNVRYLGPILDDPQWAQPWTPPWPIENRDPLLLVGFSSTFQDQGPVLRRIVRALAGLPVRALVTLGEMLPESEVPAAGQVRVVRSAPHRQILPHASLLITHCGHGTTMKALAAGVPMVCLPMGRDQNDTAARVVHAGAGVKLGPSASAEKIASAVARVLGDERYRAGARRMGQAIAEELARIDPVAELESMAHPRASAPKSTGAISALDSRTSAL